MTQRHLHAVQQGWWNTAPVVRRSSESWRSQPLGQGRQHLRHTCWRWGGSQWCGNVWCSPSASQRQGGGLLRLEELAVCWQGGPSAQQPHTQQSKCNWCRHTAPITWLWQRGWHAFSCLSTRRRCANHGVAAFRPAVSQRHNSSPRAAPPGSRASNKASCNTARAWSVGVPGCTARRSGKVAPSWQCANSRHGKRSRHIT